MILRNFSLTEAVALVLSGGIGWLAAWASTPFLGPELATLALLVVFAGCYFGGYWWLRPRWNRRRRRDGT